MHRFKLLVSLFVLMTAFSCKSEKAVSFYLENPFQNESYQTLVKAPATPYLRFQVLGDLDSQLIPCDCFMRPNGGLERLDNFFTKRPQPALPLFSLGGFWSEAFVNDPQRDIKLDLVADFLSKSHFEAILLSSRDLAFFRAYRGAVGEKKYDAYLARITSLPWVLPVGMSEADLTLIKALPKAFASKTLSDVQVVALSSSSDMDKASKELAAKLSASKTTLVLSDLDRSDLKNFESLYQKFPMVFLTSTSNFNKPTALPSGPLLVFLSEKRSRSLAEYTIWDRPKWIADASWANLSLIRNLEFNWEQALGNVVFKDHSSLAAMQKEFDARDDAEVQQLDSDLRMIRGMAPDITHPVLRYDIASQELAVDYAGKNRLSDRLKKIMPAEPK